MKTKRFQAALGAVMLTAAAGAAFAQYGQPPLSQQQSNQPGYNQPAYNQPGFNQGNRPGNQPSEWEIQSRIQTAQQRIERGRGNGLSKREAARLQGELDSIRNREAQLRADGRLGRRDRDELDRRLSVLNGHIKDEGG